LGLDTDCGHPTARVETKQSRTIRSTPVKSGFRQVRLEVADNPVFRESLQ
jgi:hypothetical protein